MPTTRPNGVHHPLEPRAPQFDFWGWRCRRRAAVDALRALSVAPALGLNGTLLTTAAELLEIEQLDPTMAEPLVGYLGEVAGEVVESTLDLCDALQTLVDRHHLRICRPWPLALLRPDWSAISVSRLSPVFVGRVDGVSFRARTPEHCAAVPPYQLCWTGTTGIEHGPVPLLGLTTGPYWEKLPPIWDWLVARRLTILCQTGIAPWPAAVGGPLASPRDRPTPVRAI